MVLIHQTHKPWLLSIIVAIILLIIFAFVYYKLTGSKPSPQQIINNIVSGGGDGGQVWTDPIEKLRADATLYAQKTWCQANGHTFSFDSNGNGICNYNEQSCLAKSNPHYDFTKGAGQNPYLEWHSEVGKCISMPFSNFINTNLCQSNILGGNAPYYQGTVTCNDTGQCTFQTTGNYITDDDGNVFPEYQDPPNCIQTSDYCESKGLDYDSGGLGSCSESDVQIIIETILGKTIVRKYKQNFQNMMKQCGHQVLSPNCAESIGTLYFTSSEIVLASAQVWLNQVINNLKDKCSGDFASDMSSFADCAWAIYQLNPAVYVNEVMTKMFAGMLEMTFGWIPGIGNLNKALQSGIGYMKKYGLIAVQAMVHYGEDAVKAMDYAGDLVISSLKSLGFPVNKVLDLCGQAIGLTVQYGIIAAKAIAAIGEDAIHIMVQALVIGAKVLNAIIGAALNPKEMANKIWNYLQSGKEIGDAIAQSLTDLKNDISKETSQLFLNSLQAMGQADEDLANIASTVQTTLNNIGGDIQSGVSHLNPLSW